MEPSREGLHDNSDIADRAVGAAIQGHITLEWQRCEQPKLYSDYMPTRYSTGQEHGRNQPSA